MHAFLALFSYPELPPSQMNQQPMTPAGGICLKYLAVWSCAHNITTQHNNAQTERIKREYTAAIVLYIILVHKQWPIASIVIALLRQTMTFQTARLQSFH